MFAVINSSNEKPIIKLLKKKKKPNGWKQVFISVPLSLLFWLNGWVQTAFHKKDRGLRLIKNSSEADQLLLSAGILFSGHSYRT